MQKKRFLIIEHNKHLLRFFLIESTKDKIHLLAEKLLRIFREGYSFSIADYILEALTLWGKEIGIKLVKEMVPLVPEVGKDGVSDIYIFTYKEEKSLESISKNLFINEKEVQKEGIINISKFLGFKNLLYVSLGEDSTDIVRYAKSSVGSLKVVAEKTKTSIQKLLNQSNFLRYLKGAEVLNAFENKLNNLSLTSVFDLRTFDGVYLEYLLNLYKLSPFLKCKKLKLNTFGSGNLDENILLIGGDRLNAVGNIPLELLSIVTGLNLKGNFRILLDKCGFFNVLQKTKKQVFKDLFYTFLLFESWGKFLELEAGSKAKLDDISADVEIVDGEAMNQMIPMFGRIFSFEGRGDVKITAREEFSIGKGKKEFFLEDLSEKLIVDSRGPLESMSDGTKLDKNISKDWFSGIGALA